MSSLVRPADAKVSVAASSSRSSVERSHRSPNGVQPMPTMATRSQMPRDAISTLLGLCCDARPDGTCLPEVVVDAARGDHTTEGHLHPVTDGDRGGIDIGELTPQATSTIEVNDRAHQWWTRRVGEPVDRERG